VLDVGGRICVHAEQLLSKVHVVAAAGHVIASAGRRRSHYR
jgi:hypothetical protein